MITQNETLWLKSGQIGESEGISLGQPVTFSKLEVGDAGGLYPDLDQDLTALVNRVADGNVITHRLDPTNSTQRIVTMRIPPSDNYNAVEALLYARYGDVEFPHTYIRLASPYPVRTVENGGSQLELKMTIRVSQQSNFTISVSGDLDSVNAEFVESQFIGVLIDSNTNSVVNRKHLFLGPAEVQLLPEISGSSLVFRVDELVDLSIAPCKLKSPPGELIRIGNQVFDDVDIVEKSRDFNLTRVNGEWRA